MKLLTFENGNNRALGAESLLNLTKVTPQQARQLDTDYLLKYRYFTILENNGQESNWYVNESDTDTDENGGTCMVSTSGLRLKRNLVNGRGYINSDWFGLINDCSFQFDGTSVPTGTDNSELLQKAIDATPVGGVLSIPCGIYLLNSTVVVNKSIDIIADKGTVLVADLVDKTKEVLRVGGAVRGKIANFLIVGAGYQCLSGIRFVAPDSQAIELDNIKVTQCRYGIYSNEGETINRIIIRNCDFTSNSIGGFYLKSFDVQYQHSAPITFEHTIVNSNGPQDWMYNTTYKGQPILDATDKFGYQIYCKGFGKLTWKGGQISNHAQAKNIAMAYFESGSGLSIYCPDFEDFTSCCNHNGDLILPDFSNIQSEDEGSAIIVKSVRGVFAEMSHVWQINSQSIFKLLYDCGDATILNVPKVGQLKYTIDVSGANQGVNTTRLYTNSDLSLLSPSAFNSISTEMLNLIDEQNNLVPNNSHNTVFDNVTVTSGKYTFGYCLDINNPNFRNAAYSEKDVLGNEKVIFAELECTQGSFPSQGAFFVEALNSTGNRIGFSWIDTKGMYSYAGSYIAYLHYLLPENTAKIRYGFTCKGNFTGSIPTHATVKSFRIFIYTNSRSGLTKSDRKTGLERNIQFLDSIPVNPTVPVNFEKGVFYLNGVDTLGWYCSKSGTISNSTTTCNGNIGDSFVMVGSTANLQRGQYVNIEGVSGTYKITDILGTTVFLSSGLTTNLVNKTLSFSAPKLNRIDSNSIDWVFVNFANYTPSLIDKYIEFDASSTSIFVNMPDATTNAGRQLTMKRIDGSSNFVTLSASIEGNTLRLRQNEYFTLVSDGTRWCILGQNKPSFGSVNFDTGTAVVTNSQLTLNAKIAISIQAFNTGTIPSAIEYVASTGSVTFYAKKADKSIETLCNATIKYSDKFNVEFTSDVLTHIIETLLKSLKVQIRMPL